jgi:hypothetical protein
VWQQVTQAFSRGEYSSPKTLLGFLGAIYVAVLAFFLAVTIVVVSSDSVRWLIGPILLFVALGTVGLLAAVLYFARKDPTPLVLGQITGGEFNEHRRITQGDSLRGERILTSKAPLEVESGVEPVEEEDRQLSDSGESGSDEGIEELPDE